MNNKPKRGIEKVIGFLFRLRKYPLDNRMVSSMLWDNSDEDRGFWTKGPLFKK